MVSSRLHGLIYAAVSEVPMMSYSSDGKLSSFLSYIGCDDCAGNAEFGTDELLVMAERAMAKRAALSHRLHEEKPHYGALVTEEIEALLQEL